MTSHPGQRHCLENNDATGMFPPPDDQSERHGREIASEIGEEMPEWQWENIPQGDEPATAPEFIYHHGNFYTNHFKKIPQAGMEIREEVGNPRKHLSAFREVRPKTTTSPMEANSRETPQQQPSPGHNGQTQQRWTDWMHRTDHLMEEILQRMQSWETRVQANEKAVETLMEEMRSYSHETCYFCKDWEETLRRAQAEGRREENLMRDNMRREYASLYTRNCEESKAIAAELRQMINDGQETIQVLFSTAWRDMMRTIQEKITSEETQNEILITEKVHEFLQCNDALPEEYKMIPRNCVINFTDEQIQNFS